GRLVEGGGRPAPGRSGALGQRRGPQLGTDPQDIGETARPGDGRGLLPVAGVEQEAARRAGQGAAVPAAWAAGGGGDRPGAGLADAGPVQGARARAAAADGP